MTAPAITAAPRAQGQGRPAPAFTPVLAPRLAAPAPSGHTGPCPGRRRAGSDGTHPAALGAAWAPVILTAAGVTPVPSGYTGPCSVQRRARSEGIRPAGFRSPRAPAILTTGSAALAPSGHAEPCPERRCASGEGTRLAGFQPTRAPVTVTVTAADTAPARSRHGRRGWDAAPGLCAPIRARAGLSFGNEENAPSVPASSGRPGPCRARWNRVAGAGIASVSPRAEGGTP